MQEYLIPTAISVASAFIGLGISVGVTKAVLSHHNKEIERLDKQIDDIAMRCVTHETFNAVKEPIHEAIQEIKADIKRILMLLSRNESDREA